MEILDKNQCFSNLSELNVLRNVALPFKPKNTSFLSEVNFASYPDLLCTNYVTVSRFTVADPGFSRVGGGNPRRVTNLLFGIIFAENCMETKKNGQGGAIPHAARSATGS